MARRNEYGQTWWGKEWLNSLAQIDFDNRLPRGRTYANNGSVTSLKIDGNRIVAKVKGSYLYKVTIEIPLFSDEQKEKLTAAIGADAVILSRLLNRELDTEISAIAARQGIGLFPRKWSDFSMDCSCPDWAVPCKHLAAVIYLVSREIDKNPFLVFDLHGLNLLESLKTAGVEIGAKAASQIPFLDDLLKIEKGSSEYEFDRDLLETIDFATLEDVRETLPQLLTEKPLFFEEGDFKSWYLKALREVSKNVKRHFEDAETRHSAEQKNENLLSFSDEIEIVLNAENNFTLQAGKCENFEQLIRALGAIEPKNLLNFSPSVIVLQTMYLFSLSLLERGAIVPQIFKRDEKVFKIRWLPATLNDSVKKVFGQISRITPPGVLKYRVFKHEPKLRLESESQTFALCSIFLTHFFQGWNNLHYEFRHKPDKIANLFFFDKAETFEKFGEASKPEAINVWLSRFYVSHKNFAPVLRVDEGKHGDFLLEVLVEDKQKPLEPPFELAKLFREKRFATIKFEVLRDLSLLAEFFPQLNQTARERGEKPLVFAADEFAAVFFEILPLMRLFGINLILPKSLKHLIRPEVSVKIVKKSAESAGFLRLDDLLDFEWRVAVGDELLSEDDFKKLVRGFSGFIKFKDRYIFLKPEELDKLHQNLQKPPKTNGADLLRIALAEEFQGRKIELTEEIHRLLEQLKSTPEIALPENLQANLRPYQRRGYEWLYKNSAVGFGSLLADDMGLGKTLQVITTLLKFKEEGRLDKEKALVVVPTSLLSNWQKEIEKFAPTLTQIIYHGASRDFQPANFDITLTTYGLVRSEIEKFKKTKWQAVIFDESQNLKNPDTAQTKAVKSLKANVFMAMSGTPVENRLSEFWSVMDIVNRGFFGGAKKFNDDFGRPIQRMRDHGAIARFRQVTAPFLLRRLKSDKSIISDLPDKIENDQYCSLTKEQAALYQKTVENALKTIEGTEENFQRQGLVLQMILALKQICNHPAQYLKKGGGKAELSGKALMLLDILENILENGEKVLLFTQYREMGVLLEEFIAQKFGIETMFLHGGSSRKKRDQMVEKFQTDHTAKVFILSLKAGGTGLNLTAAQNVIHYDLWWNPAVEAQATDRAYRIGQRKNVMVYRLITKNTFEERINEMINNKKELANLTVGVGENWVGNLSNKELRNIFSLAV